MLSNKTVLYLKRFNLNTKSVKVFKPMKYSTNNRIKTIEFQTCGQLYEELRQKNPKLYRNSPSNGVKVNVEYVDTLADNERTSSGDVRTVVAIHGVPGHYSHFSGLIEYFSKSDSKVRVIAPNFPDFGLTRQTMAFWHSNQERTQFLRDFLRAINVSTIDTLVCHSSGVHPISVLWSDPKELTIKSIGLFCPQSLWFNDLKQYEYLCRLFIPFARNKFGIKLMDIIGLKHITHKWFFPIIYEDTGQAFHIMLFYMGAQQHLLHQRLEYLKSNKIPTLVVFGEQDGALKIPHCNRVIQDLGADQRDIIYYSSDNSIEKDCERENSIKVLWFRNGKHFCYNKCSDIVNKQLFMHLLSHK